MHTNRWDMLWDDAIPTSLTATEVEKKSNDFAIADVYGWVEKRGGLTGRINFLQTYMSDSKLYQMVILPLLSMCTTGF